MKAKKVFNVTYISNWIINGVSTSTIERTWTLGESLEQVATGLHLLSGDVLLCVWEEK